MENGNKKPVIAIDGVSGSGKSTMARTLAKKYGYLYVDSGAMYRALTYYAMSQNYLNDGELLKSLLVADLSEVDITFGPDGHTMLNGRDVEKEIRSMEVSENVSMIATIPEVRRAMVMLQQKMPRDKGIVMDGRDIGTVVFPDADVKLFVVSDPKVRAERRYEELKAKGADVDFDSVLENIVSRDHTDSHRETSPRTKAHDAVEIDKSNMTIDEQNAAVDEIISSKLKKINNLKHTQSQ